MRSLIPLSVIAGDLSDDIGDTVHKHYGKFLRYAKNGFQQLHTFISDDVSVKSVVLDQSPQTNMIEMPCDFITETKVGIIRGGRMCVLGWDPDLRTSYPVLGNETSQDNLIDSILSGASDGTGSLSFYNPYYNGNPWDGPAVGYLGGGNFNGYYNIDRTNGVLEASTRLPTGTQLIVEYKSDGVSNGLKVIPSEFEMAVKYFSKWQFNFGTKLGDKAQEAYEVQFYQLKRLYTDTPISILTQLMVQQKNNSILS